MQRALTLAIDGETSLLETVRQITLECAKESDDVEVLEKALKDWVQETVDEHFDQTQLSPLTQVLAQTAIHGIDWGTIAVYYRIKFLEQIREMERQ